MFLRMNAETFDELLHLIRPDLEKQTTHLTDPIPPHFKLAAATTRFLYTILKKKIIRKLLKHRTIFKTKEIFQFQKTNLKKKLKKLSTSNILKIDKIAKLCRNSVKFFCLHY